MSKYMENSLRWRLDKMQQARQKEMDENKSLRENVIHLLEAPETRPFLVRVCPGGRSQDIVQTLIVTFMKTRETAIKFLRRPSNKYVVFNNDQPLCVCDTEKQADREVQNRQDISNRERARNGCLMGMPPYFHWHTVPISYEDDK